MSKCYCIPRSIILLLLLTLSLSSQTRELELKDVILKARTTLGVKVHRGLQWIANSEQFSYIVVKDSSEILYRGRATENRVSPELTLEEMNTLLKGAGLGGLAKFPGINWLDESRFWIWRKDTLVSIDLESSTVKTETWFDGSGVANRDVHTKTFQVAFTRGNSLFIMHPGGVERSVKSVDSTGSIIVGQDIHRREFGIRKGTFWSPNGTYLAFYEKDVSPVTDYPYVDFSTTPAVVKPEKYPMSGMANHIARVGIYHVASDKTIYVQTGQPADQYLTNLAWSPDEKYILLAQINREQNHLRMMKYSANTGELVDMLFEEKDSAYVDPQVAPYFPGEDNSRFLWLSRRDGWNHLYLYNINGELLRQLTSGEWEITKLLGSDTEGERVYFEANRESPVSRDAYTVDLKDSRLLRLTQRDGTHVTQVSRSGAFFLDKYSSLEAPGVQELRAKNGNLLRILARSPNPLKEYRIGEIDIVPFIASDGSKLFGRVLFPADFNPSEKYPLLVYVYGGPHSQQVRNTWMGGNGTWPYWLRYMASKGYLVLTVDNRGTNYRGLEFEQATFRQLGTIEIADQVETIRQLFDAGYVDSKRVGVVGWSYGGFMASSLILREPELFKVAVAGGPVTDWKFYETIYTERYMDTPVENPEGYRASSLMTYTKDLKGKLLLIHGTTDPIVVWQQSVAMIDDAVEKGVHIDYAIYPGEKHGVRGKKRLHLFEKMTRYIMENL